MEETAITILESNAPTLERLALAYMPLNATQEEASRKIIREIANVEQWLRMKPDLAGVCKEKAGKDSLVYAVKQCIQDGLSLAPSSNLAYLIPGRVKVGENKYEWVVNYSPTAEGMLSIARQAGRILDHKRPVCEYDESTGVVLSVTVEFLIPSVPAPRWDVVVFGPGHFQKWSTASAKKNNGNPNPNYSSFNGGIDPEFAGTKAIMHGLKKRGMNTEENVVHSGTTAVVSTTAPVATKSEPEYTPHTEVINEDKAPDLI